jgi:hypothetical protein
LCAASARDVYVTNASIRVCGRALELLPTPVVGDIIKSRNDVSSAWVSQLHVGRTFLSCTVSGRAQCACDPKIIVTALWTRVGFRGQPCTHPALNAATTGWCQERGTVACCCIHAVQHKSHILCIAGMIQARYSCCRSDLIMTGQHFNRRSRLQPYLKHKREFHLAGLRRCKYQIIPVSDRCVLTSRLSATCIAGRGLHWVEEAGDHRAPPYRAGDFSETRKMLFVHTHQLHRFT